MTTIYRGDPGAFSRVVSALVRGVFSLVEIPRKRTCETSATRERENARNARKHGTKTELRVLRFAPLQGAFRKKCKSALDTASHFLYPPIPQGTQRPFTMSTTPRQNTAKNATPNTDGRTRFVQFNVRMTPAEADEARRLASASGMSFSQLVRAALRFFKKNNPF